jgi:hypothetical protein
MESVSSCSPGASTSSASAAGACFPHRSSAFTAHPPVVATNKHPTITTETTWKTELMPHARGERRYDTFLVPAGTGKGRWSQVVAGGMQNFSTFSCYREPRQQLTSYFPQNSGGPASWNQKDASQHHWRRDHPVGPLETTIPFRLSSGMARSNGQFDHRGMSSRHLTPFHSHTRPYANNYEQRRNYTRNEHDPAECIKKETSNSSGSSRYRSIVAISHNVVIPKEISPGVDNADTSAEGSLGKRSILVSNRSESTPTPKRSRAESGVGRFDKLDLLCSATLELGPLLENPSGCSCPKSKCIALYCDCFKAGRRCNPDRCSCFNCKNTVEESGPNGARSKVGSRVSRTEWMRSPKL